MREGVAMIRVQHLCLGMLVGLVSAGATAGALGSDTNQESRVVKTSSQHIKDAIVEHVKIYSQINKDSNKKLVRNGRLIRYKDAQATVLICHGFMCDKFDVGFLRSIFPRGRFNVMTFDFRAHGEESDGQLCTFGMDEAYDVIAAADFLRNRPELLGKPLFVYGFSMGAVSAIMAQAQRKGLFDAMVLDCPFDRSENIIKKGLESMKFSLFGYEFNIPGKDTLQKYVFHPYVQSFVKAVLRTVANMDPRNINVRVYPISPAESAQKIDAPCLFIHCKNDEKVPVVAIQNIYNRVTGYKELWITEGRRHFDSFFYDPEAYSEKVSLFFDRILKDRALKNVPACENFLPLVTQVNKGTHNEL